MDQFTSVLLVIKECYVYQIPPLLKSEGHRASDWNVDSFLWKGRLRLVTIRDELSIRLEDGETGELFAACPYDATNGSVETVVDSSRYFVIRVVDPETGKHAYLGMGFADRSEAFDFNVALQDFSRQTKLSSEPSKDEGSLAPPVDYSLKEGQTISLNLSGKLGGTKKRVESAGKDSAAPITLPPPPGAGLSKLGKQSLVKEAFGDFATSTQGDNSGWAKFD